ncbi:cytochrome b-c1 complex, subunit 6 [Artemisia annua]|uniref:Complex III subunit VI n=1 Tax=Artemisia annua TaxID=35608 RepID=A0A2U1PK05_ARTAN|nr:cytochrome b-c1 complex, subunit 6 [Artemisia annua]
MKLPYPSAKWRVRTGFHTRIRVASYRPGYDGQSAVSGARKIDWVMGQIREFWVGVQAVRLQVKSLFYNYLKGCVKRVQADETGHKHCTGQYFDYWQCVDKCHLTTYEMRFKTPYVRTMEQRLEILLVLRYTYNFQIKTSVYINPNGWRKASETPATLSVCSL